MGSRQEMQRSLMFQLLYQNLGGEMMYILRQRLQAQKIGKEKADQVLTDVLSNLVRSRSYWLRTFLSNAEARVDSLLLKVPFESVISCSTIMKLSPCSYDKLYDLMVGVFKWQVARCPLPSSLMLLSLNHITSLISMAAAISPGLRNLVKEMHDSFVQQFSSLNKYQWFVLRNLLLSRALAGVRTRVSILIREQKQDSDSGFYIIPLPTAPHAMFNGRITHYDENGKVIREDGLFSQPVSEKTDLGLDIYTLEPEREKKDAEPKAGVQSVSKSGEASLLSDLVHGRKDSTHVSSTVALDFSFADFDDQEHGDSTNDVKKGSTGEEGRKVPLVRRHTLAEQFELELDPEDEGCDDELLALMDS